MPPRLRYFVYFLDFKMYVGMFHIEFSVQMTMISHSWYEVLLETHPAVDLTAWTGI